jgi:SAM-dependent methyltransferase
MPNSGSVYSPQWFELFLRRIDPAQTARECDFLARQLPLPNHRRLLDLCCGEGRHATPLARRGYAVTGVDASEAALRQARNAGDAPIALVAADIRCLASLFDAITPPFDGTICMWQSFGYFDDATNRSILAAMVRLLRPGGRAVMDVYHRDFFEANQGERRFERGGIQVVETKRMVGARLFARLDYPDADRAADQFEWQLYTPQELIDHATGAGLAPVLVCSGFEPEVAASPRVPRFQVVFARS